MVAEGWMGTNADRSVKRDYREMVERWSGAN
jgi:hypothetical protein